MRLELGVGLDVHAPHVATRGPPRVVQCRPHLPSVCTGQLGLLLDGTGWSPVLVPPNPSRPTLDFETRDYGRAMHKVCKEDKTDLILRQVAQESMTSMEMDAHHRKNTKELAEGIALS